MATLPIDLDSLLAPLDAGEQGAGIDLRSDFSPASTYQRLRDARSSARADERARDAAGDTDNSTVEGWREILDLGQAAFTAQSKDFEVAAWLTEALVRLYGLAGLTAGAGLVTGLCDQYWDTGFPQPDEEGLEGRASPIGGLSGSSADGTIMQPLRRLALFRRTDGTEVGIYQWDQAEETAGLNEDRRAARYSAGVPELETLKAEARLDRNYLTQVGIDAANALATWRAMENAVDLRFGSEAPPLRKVTGILERISEVVVSLGGVVPAGEEGGADADQMQDQVAASGDAGAATGSRTGGSPGKIMTREDALREMDRIAEFFKRTEPHSPLAYTLEEAVRRGRMSLAELLAEVLPDGDARASMLARLGIRPPE